MKFANLFVAFCLGALLAGGVAVYQNPALLVGDTPIDPNADLPHFLLADAPAEIPMCVSVKDIYSKEVSGRVQYFIDGGVSMFAYDAETPRCSIRITKSEAGYIFADAPDDLRTHFGFKPDECTNLRLVPISATAFYPRRGTTG